MSSKLIGHVGVDSGQLLLCDPCYIDSEWVKEEFEDLRTYRHKKEGYKLTYRADFKNYEEPLVIYDGKTMNELLATGEWEELQCPPSLHEFSYNACCKQTLSEDGHGELNYKHGTPGAGVAFSTAFGDGLYPVVAHYMEDGTLRSVEVVFQTDEEDEEETWDDEEIDD